MHKTPRIREVVTAVVVLLLAGSTPRDAMAQSAWQTLTTDHFEIYYERQAVDNLDRVVVEAERAYGRLSMDFRFDLAEKVPLILLGTTRDLPTNRAEATNIVVRSGAPARDHLLLSLEPADQREAILTHELTHHFEFQIVPESPQLPSWLYEGLSEYQRTRWIPSGPSVARGSAVIPPVSRLTSADREWGRVVFEFIGDEFGVEGIRRYLAALRGATTNDDAIREVFGLTSSEFDRDFERYVKTR
jgi:hypothetical protein